MGRELAKFGFALSGLFIAAQLPAALHAQEAALTRDVTLEYVGQLSESVETRSRRVTGDPVFGGATSTSGIVSRPLASDLPAYPIQPGDEFKLTLKGQLPTLAALEQSGAAPDLDGIYRFRVSTGFGESAGSISSIEVSEPFRADLATTSVSFQVEFDPQTNTYSGGVLRTDVRRFAGVQGLEVPTYEYDAASDSYRVCGGSGATACSTGVVPLTSIASSSLESGDLSSVQARIPGGIEVQSTRNPDERGFFDLLFDGIFDLFVGEPAAPGTGQGIPVPAPPMIVLFGLASFGVLFGRRFGATPRA